MQIGSANGAGSAFILAGTQKAVETTADQAQSADTQGLSVSSSHSGSTNMLANNFVHSGVEQSRYVSGLLNSFKIENEFKNRMQSIVSTYSALAAQTDNYAEKGLIGKQAADAVQDLKDREVTDKMEEKLEQAREEQEEKVQEDLAEGEAGVEDASAVATGEAVDGGDDVSAAAVQSPETLQENIEQQAASSAEGQAAAVVQDVQDTSAVADVAHIDLVV